MDYKKVLEECNARADMYQRSDAVWNLLHERQCADAITDLLSRTEEAERERDHLREAMKPNCLLCDSIHPDNGNCTAVGGFCTAVPAAHCPLIPKLRDKLATAEADNKKLIATMMQLKRTGKPERLSVVYELEYDSLMSHKTMEDVAEILFRGLMDADLKLRGKKEE